MNVSDDKDIFRGLFADHPSKISSIFFSFFTSPINIFLAYGVIWYEKNGSGNGRTLVNKMISSLCFSGILYFLFGQYGDMARYLFGPIPSNICLGQVVMKNAISSQIILYISTCSVIKYIFIFWIKNPAGVDDGFWSKFLTLWISGFSFVFNFVIFFLPGRQPLFFYICANIDPKIDQSLPKKLSGILEMLSLLLHIIIKIRILVYKTKIDPEISNCFLAFKKATATQTLDKHSIANFSTNFFSISIFSVLVIVISKVNSLSPSEINEYPNYIYVYVHQFIYPNLIGFVTSGIYYINNPSLRNTIVNELKLIYNIL